MNPFQCNGVWWTPDAPSLKVGGKLTFSDEDGIILSLLGGLGESKGFATDKRHPVILGACYDAPSPRITLAECSQLGYSLSSPGLGRESYLAQKIFLGAHLAKQDDQYFTGCDLELGGLLAWAGRGTKDVSRDKKQNHDALTVNYESPPSLDVLVGETRVSLYWAKGYETTIGRMVIEERAAFSISAPEPLDDDEWRRRYTGPLQDLLTLALDAPSRIEKLKFCREDPLSIVESVRPRIYSKQPDENKLLTRLLFTLEDVRGRYERLIRRWLEIHKDYQQACSVFFSGLYGELTYLEMKLVPVVQALQLYDDRRHERSPRERIPSDLFVNVPEADKSRLLGWLSMRDVDTFAETLSALFDEQREVMQPLAPAGKEAFVEEAVKLRRYALYHRGDPGFDNYANRLYFAVHALGTLMKACLLTELEFTTDARIALFQRNANYTFLQRMRAGFPARSKV